MNLVAIYLHDPAPAIQRLLVSPVLDPVMMALSMIAEGWVLAALAIWLSYQAHRGWRGTLAGTARFLASMALAGALVWLAKNSIQAPRPLGLLGPERVRVLLEPLRSGAFPSGHSATAAAFATWAALESGWARRWPWLLAFLCGLSRIYVGAHWATDVCAGWVLGAAVAAAVCLCFPPRPAAGAAAGAKDQGGRVRPATTPLRLSLALAGWFLVALNYPFLRALVDSMGGLRLGNLKDLLLLATALFALLFLMFYLTAWRGLTKALGLLLLLTGAVASCAVLVLDTEFSPLIIRSVFRTDLVEAREVLSWAWLAHFLLLGVAPGVLLIRAQITYPPAGRFLLHKAAAIGATLLLAAGLYLPNQLFFNAFADNAVNHRLKSKAVPFNYLGALAEYLGEELSATRTARAGGGGGGKSGGGKAHFEVRRGPSPGPGRHAVMIFVLGESARARSFSLNGYARETNPRLRRQAAVVSFTRVEACATATAQALPCLFSSFGEKGFSYRRAEETDNLLDVAKQAGFEVTWYENGMGTQSVTRGVTEVNLGSYYKAERDRILIDRLPPRAELERAGKDQLIVLHQRGSHGPDYQQRYTEEFRVFRPDCEGAVLKSCSQEAVVNAYDNTILYTDANLDDAIEYLKGLGDGFDTALVYVSDHGESTGEGGWYMHGLPKALAPDDQVRVPLITWISPGLQAAGRLDLGCVAARKDEPFSQDNVFHSVVGLLGIETSAYDRALDIFAPCRGKPPTRDRASESASSPGQKTPSAR